MAKRNLTDRTLKALKPAPAGKLYDVWDTGFPGFGVRVSDTGRKTFVLAARFNGSSHPTRRALGSYPAISLADAHEKARAWLKLIAAGRDPAVIAEQARQAELRKQSNTFTAAAEAFIRHIHRQKLRSAGEMEHQLRQEFVARWPKRPVTEITSNDIKKVIREAVERDAKYAAFKHFALIRRFFNWAIGTDDYGIEVNPCSRLKPADLIGERNSRTRTLSDDELRAFWRVTGRWDYPYGPLYRLLVLTGVRLNEIAGASWSEIDLAARTLKVPLGRVKKVKGQEPHPRLVPLSDAAVEVLESLPRFKSGDHLFSFSAGRRPLKPNQFSDPKAKLDKKMLHTMQAMARKRGDDHRRVTLPHWINHDVRRTMRTHLSALKVAEEVRETLLEHVRPGIKGVYDLYEYADEKREALILWSARLRSIVDPPPANVVEMKARA